MTRCTWPLVLVETVADVARPQPDRLATVEGDTDGVNTPGGRGRVVVVVAPAVPPSSVGPIPCGSKGPVAPGGRGVSPREAA